MEHAATNTDQMISALKTEGLSDESLSYAEYVELGRKLVRKVEVYQCMIAMYACKVCQIRHGGISDKLYTIKDYATDIGVPVKTLQQWTLVYRNVIARLGRPVDSITSDDWKIASRVNDNLLWGNRLDNREKKTNRRAFKYKSTVPDERVRELFKEELTGPSFATEMRHWISSIRSIKGKLLVRDLSLTEEGNLLELMSYFDEMSDHINDFLTKKGKRK